MSDFTKPKQNFRPHGGPYVGKPVEELVRDPAGRAWLAGHIPTQPPERQRVGLAWLSWALQREVKLEDLDAIAAG